MRTPRTLAVLAAVAATAGLTACGTYDPYGQHNYPQSPLSNTWPQSAPAPQQVGYVEYGRIAQVQLINPGTRASGHSPAGTAIGAVAGGVLGNTIGHGSGRAVATILGAVAGAAVGNSLATRNTPYNTAGPVYRVWVQTDQGAMRTYDVGSTGDLRPGDRVRIENGVIYMG